MRVRSASRTTAKRRAISVNKRRRNSVMLDGWKRLPTGRVKTPAFMHDRASRGRACEDALNAARSLDPEGEAAPRVVAARRAIEAVAADAGGRPEKPPKP
jgi:hypothetical protein